MSKLLRQGKITAPYRDSYYYLCKCSGSSVAAQEKKETVVCNPSETGGRTDTDLGETSLSASLPLVDQRLVVAVVLLQGPLRGSQVDQPQGPHSPLYNAPAWSAVSNPPPPRGEGGILGNPTLKPFLNFGCGGSQNSGGTVMKSQPRLPDFISPPIEPTQLHRDH